MSVPSKIHNIPLVQIQAEERLTATSELNLASCLVTGCSEVGGMGYWGCNASEGLVLILSGIFIVFGVGFYVGYYGEKLEVLQKILFK
ncbi:MAG: hypothetical protein KAT65_22730 [Methanophagales archaeon]|nr:hypothetical protein [Methanophagales archaeon]